MEREKKEAARLSARGRLLEIILAKSFKYSDVPIFKLRSSPEPSRYYFDCKPTTLDPEGARLVGEIVFEMIRTCKPAAIGGLALGAVPIALAVALVSAEKGQPIRAFIVRDERKDHGTGRLIEGEVNPGEDVVVVDDVITTGSSTIKAIQAAQEAGLKVKKVVVLIDREEGGRERIEKLVPDFEAVFTRTEIMSRYRAK